jgi:probable rRNA maturation factor
LEDEDYHIDLCFEERSVPADTQRIPEAIRNTLRRHRRSRCRINVAVVDDARMAALNQAHLGKTGTTDCLAFDLRDGDRCEAVEGDIAVSWETAQRQARARGISTEAELTLYAVHGLLHLLGYDDCDAEQAAAMHRVEDDILTAVGIGPVYGAAPK